MPSLQVDGGKYVFGSWDNVFTLQMCQPNTKEGRRRLWQERWDSPRFKDTMDKICAEGYHLFAMTDGKLPGHLVYRRLYYYRGPGPVAIPDKE